MRANVLLAACAGLFLPSAASAIVVADNNPEPNNPAPNRARPVDALGDPGWDNVGWRGFGTTPSDGATAVYLGSRYVLTANHVGAGPVTFGTDDPSGGTTYSLDPAFAPIRFANPGVGTGFSDLLLYRISTDPGLPALNIASAPPPPAARIRYVGTGRRRGSVTQTSATVPPNGGYFWAADRDKAYGDDFVSTASSLSGDGSGGQSVTFRTRFDPFTGDTMVADKDSGSAAFAFNTALNRWELSGIVSAITGFSTQPAASSTFGQEVLSLDVSAYRSQFPANVPEPAAAGLLGGAAVGGLLARRRRVR